MVRPGDLLLDEAFAEKGRFAHLDVTRVCCVVAAAIGSFEPKHYEWNTLYGQSWVLPLAWLVSGLCFSLTKRSDAEYLRRMLLYLAMGLVVNVAAWMINSWVVGHDVWLLVHQMNFVHVLFWSLLLLVPMKRRLRRLAQEEAEKLGEAGPEKPGESWVRLTGLAFNGGLLDTAIMLLCGVCLIGCAFRFGLSAALRSLFMRLHFHNVTLGLRQMRTAFGAADLGSDVARSLQSTCSGLFLLLAFPAVSRGNQSYLAWLLLLNLYLHRLLLGYGPADFAFGGFYLVMLAMTAQYLGLAGRRQLGLLLHRYWMVLVFLLCFCATPGMHGSLRNQPPENLYDAERYILVEALIVVAWLVAGQHMVDKAIVTEDGFGWIHLWAVVAFLLMQGAHWLFPRPFGWLVLLAIAPMCWFCHRRD